MKLLCFLANSWSLTYNKAVVVAWEQEDFFTFYFVAYYVSPLAPWNREFHLRGIQKAKNKRPNISLTMRRESKQSLVSDRQWVESSLRASQWNDVLDRRWKLWVFAGESVCVHVLSRGFLNPIVCVCVCVTTRSRGRNHCTDAPGRPCGAASNSHDPEFLLEYQQMEIKAECAAAALITDRSGLHPLNHPDPGYVWLPSCCTLRCCQSGPGWRLQGPVVW